MGKPTGEQVLRLMAVNLESLEKGIQHHSDLMEKAKKETEAYRIEHPGSKYVSGLYFIGGGKKRSDLLQYYRGKRDALKDALAGVVFNWADDWKPEDKPVVANTDLKKAEEERIKKAIAEQKAKMEADFRALLAKY